jgi:hypothetical protein
MNDTLNTFLNEGFGLLTRAAVDKKSPMRTPVLGTTVGDELKLRTIVLRKFEKDKNELVFFTDIRSEKVSHLRQNSNVSVLFYHPKKQIQIHVTGNTSIHHKEEVSQFSWKNLSPFGRKSYATDLAPSTKLATESNNLNPEIWYAQSPPSTDTTDVFYKNFAVLKVKMRHVEILSLNRDGHRRASFNNVEAHDWSGSWIVP